MTATKKRKRRPAANAAKWLSQPPLTDATRVMLDAMGPLLNTLTARIVAAQEELRPSRAPTLPSPAPVQMLPVTFTPPFAAPKTTRQEIATVVCQAIRAAGLRPTMCDECSSLHLNAAGGRPIRPDELTPSVRRACRLMPQEILAAWQDAV